MKARLRDCMAGRERARPCLIRIRFAVADIPKTSFDSGSQAERSEGDLGARSTPMKARRAAEGCLLNGHQSSPIRIGT
jgi:hypothetical protein